MYKKISILLCIVVSLFFIVPLLYLWWTKEPTAQSNVIKGPFIGIYLRNLTATNHSVLLYDIPNTSFVLDRSVWENQGENNLSQKPPWSSKSLVLECHSNVPVKWKYNGAGGLVAEMRHQNRREVKNIDDKSTYWFTTSVEFLTISEQIVGSFTCSALDFPENNAYFHLYVKGFKTFITSEELREEVGSNEEILIPCPISDPDKATSIHLRRFLQPLHAEVYHIADPEIIREFDPKRGYTLEPGYWGSYACSNKETLESSGIIRIFKPRSLVVAGDYLSEYSTFAPIPKDSLIIRCYATENVTLRFVNFNPFKRIPVFHYNDSIGVEFPYSSRIFLRNEFFRDFSAVECLTTKDERVLRVWKYLKKEESDKVMTNFDATRKEYECCTDPGVQIIPRLTQASCYTQTECEMKRHCVNLDRKCPFPEILNQPTYKGNPGCAIAKIGNNPSGILECSFQNFTKTSLYFYNKKADFHTTSTDFRKKKVPLDKLLRVTQMESYDKEMASFICSGPRLFFANGFQWSLLRRKGDDKPGFIMEKSEVENTYVELVSETLHLPVTQVQSRVIACHAPLVFSDGWVNATVRYRRPTPSTPDYQDSVISLSS